MFHRVLSDLINKKMLSSADDRILVICGGSYDASVLRDAGIKYAVISNLDARFQEGYAPFDWAHEDAESLSFPDGSFDWVFVHAGLHHCVSPHRALLEMCRVTRKGIVVIEARDSFLMRIAVALGLAVDYELDAVAISDFKWGGIRNSTIPNYIYRWTEREVIKTIECFMPEKIHRFLFYYGIRFPTERLTMSSYSKRALARILGGLAKAAQQMFPKQCNEFGFVVLKTTELKPWIREVDGSFEMRRDYKMSFNPKKYKRWVP